MHTRSLRKLWKKTTIRSPGRRNRLCPRGPRRVAHRKSELAPPSPPIYSLPREPGPRAILSPSRGRREARPRVRVRSESERSSGKSLRRCVRDGLGGRRSPEEGKRFGSDGSGGGSPGFVAGGGGAGGAGRAEESKLRCFRSEAEQRRPRIASLVVSTEIEVAFFEREILIPVS